MRAKTSGKPALASSWVRLALLAAAQLLVLAIGWAPASAAGGCLVPERTKAEQLFADFTAALASRHPDRVTRLYALDGSLHGFASPVVRSGYMPIRDYFLYFLQFEPKAEVIERTVDTGCNFLIDHGTYVWTLRSRATGAIETRQARYRVIYELSGGSWLIAQHGDELAGAALEADFAVPPSSPTRPAIVKAATGTAVAGFIKRVEPPARASAAAPKTVSADKDDVTPSPPQAVSKTKPRAPRRPSPEQERFGLDSVPRDMQ